MDVFLYERSDASSDRGRYGSLNGSGGGDSRLDLVNGREGESHGD